MSIFRGWRASRKAWEDHLGAAAVLLYRAGVVRFNDPEVSTYPITGIDVSHYQGEIDRLALRKAGIRFAHLKSTEGRHPSMG